MSETGDSARDVFDVIQKRRSVRKYIAEIPDDDRIRRILKAGIWAPSGLNNQPWKFTVLKERADIDGLGAFTKYKNILKAASAAVCVFLDTEEMYNRDKDIQAIGACIQNMLLQAHSMKLSTCWLGEILNRKDDVRAYLQVPSGYELMAVITLGFPDEPERKGIRKPLGDFLLD